MRTYDRDAYFRSVRASFGNLNQGQVDGFNAILAEAEKRQIDARFVAYMLATAWWETARTMQAVREFGRGAGHDYGKADPTTGQAYYGRGLVQLTWKTNYQKMSEVCGVDLVGNPDLALQLDIAVTIMFEGMLAGSFTGKKLADYFTATVTDWVNARRIVNGTDQAAAIAGFAKSFFAALVLVDAPVQTLPPLKPSPAPAGSSPAPAGGSKPATTQGTSPMTGTTTTAIQAEVPNVDFLQGALNTVEHWMGTLTSGLGAAKDPTNTKVSATPGSTGFFGTIGNIEAAIGKLGEIKSDFEKKDIQEGVADGVDLLTLGFATLATFGINLPVVSTIFAEGLNLHSGGTDKTA